MFILCSPHNPVGRVWKKDELLKLGQICLKNDVKIISDEIHSDFIYPGHQHHVFASLKKIQDILRKETDLTVSVYRIHIFFQVPDSHIKDQ